jgi:hypothetical protein
VPSAGIMASAVHIAAPTCTDVLTEPFNNFTTNPWTNVGVNAECTIVAGRTGTAAKVVGYGNGIFFDIPVAQRSDVLMFGCAFRTATFSEQPHVIGFHAASGRVGRVILSSGSIAQAHDPAAVAIPGALSPPILVNTWSYIEVQTKLSGNTSTGWTKARLNGVEVWNVTNVQTGHSTAPDTVYTAIEIGSHASTTVERLWDDLYVSTGSACSFKGDPNPVSSPTWDTMTPTTTWATMTPTTTWEGM